MVTASVIPAVMLVPSLALRESITLRILGLLDSGTLCSEVNLLALLLN